MTLLNLDKVSRHFGDVPLFEDVSLHVDAGDRIGVVGDNGTGKTTLIEILVGTEEPDAGSRQTRRDLRIAYAAQIPALAAGTTVLEHVLAGDGTFAALEAQLQQLEARLAERPDDERLLDDYGHLSAIFEAGGGYERQHTCEKVLSGLGFAEAQWSQDVQVLSGGEKSRLVLASLMTAPKDLLVLDEPTNHLDLESIEFLADTLSKSTTACVVVSHDRHFLDAVATSILDVGGGGAQRYRGNWSAFRRQRDEQLLAEARAYKSQHEFVAKEMEFIRRNMAGRMSAQAKGRLKRLQRLELLQRPQSAKGAVKLRFGGGRGLAGQQVMAAKDLTVRLPGGRVLVRDASFRIDYGQTIAILGRNGAGKSSLLRVLAGLTPPSSGTLDVGRKVRVGWFDQEMRDLPTEGTVLDALRRREPTTTEKELRDHLALFLFSGDDVDTRIEALSGGEKRRLGLALLVRNDHDLLCLDEPTNHLDVTTTERLEEALRTFPGTTVLVSHDRELVDALADRVFWLEDGGLAVHDGGLAECLAARAARAAATKSREDRSPQAKRSGSAPREPAAPGRIRNPQRFEQLEAEIIAMEEQLEALRARMAEPASYRDAAVMRQLQDEERALQAKLDEAYARWESW